MKTFSTSFKWIGYISVLHSHHLHHHDREFSVITSTFIQVVFAPLCLLEFRSVSLVQQSLSIYQPIENFDLNLVEMDENNNNKKILYQVLSNEILLCTLTHIPN